MSRRKRTLSPDQQADEARARSARKAEVERLRSQGLVVKCDPQWNIIVTRRLDVFALLHERKALTDPQLVAIRRLETTIGVMMGHERPEQSLDRVDSSTSGAPGQNVSQAMIDASAIVREVMATIGPVHAKLIDALLSGHGAALTRWRATVAAVTDETRSEVQSAMIRQACKNLTAAWQAFDYRARERAA